MRPQPARARSSNATAEAGWPGAQVDLEHLVAGDRAGVGHPEGHVRAAAAGGRGAQIRVAELGAGQAMAERVERRQVLLVIPAVADVDALGIGGGAAGAERPARPGAGAVLPVGVHPVGGVPGPGNRVMRCAGWLPDDVASVDEEVDAGHECRGAAEQEDDGAYHVLRLGVPA